MGGNNWLSIVGGTNRLSIEVRTNRLSIVGRANTLSTVGVALSIWPLFINHKKQIKIESHKMFQVLSHNEWVQLNAHLYFSHLFLNGIILIKWFLKIWQYFYGILHNSFKTVTLFLTWVIVITGFILIFNDFILIVTNVFTFRCGTKRPT